VKHTHMGVEMYCDIGVQFGYVEEQRAVECFERVRLKYSSGFKSNIIGSFGLD